MHVFIDTEFNSFKGRLISLALVAMDGRELYCQRPITAHEAHPWVAANVLPVIERASYAETVTALGLSHRIAEFLADYPSVHLVADWPEDVQHFCEALITGPGYRVATPPLTMEVRRDLDAESAVPHNALHDARAIRDQYLTLMGDT